MSTTVIPTSDTKRRVIARVTGKEFVSTVSLADTTYISGSLDTAARDAARTYLLSAVVSENEAIRISSHVASAKTPGTWLTPSFAATLNARFKQAVEAQSAAEAAKLDKEPTVVNVFEDGNEFGNTAIDEFTADATTALHDNLDAVLGPSGAVAYRGYIRGYVSLDDTRKALGLPPVGKPDSIEIEGEDLDEHSFRSLYQAAIDEHRADADAAIFTEGITQAAEAEMQRNQAHTALQEQMTAYELGISVQAYRFFVNLIAVSKHEATIAAVKIVSDAFTRQAVASIPHY